MIILVLIFVVVTAMVVDMPVVIRNTITALHHLPCHYPQLRHDRNEFKHS